MGAHSTGSEEGAVEAAETQSLYERLGGAYAIAVVVDDFIDRIMVDPRLNANPRVDEAHHRVSAQGFKFYVTEQVCWAAGGPQTYSGRTMLDTHSELLISAAEWDAFMDDFHQTLAKFGVSERERGAGRAPAVYLCRRAHPLAVPAHCGGVVYAPPVTRGCRVLAGAAAVR